MRFSKLLLPVALCMALFFNSGCATIFLSSEEHCTIKPRDGEPNREIHVGALILDILIFFPAAFVDWADCAIYQPCNGGAGNSNNNGDNSGSSVEQHHHHE